MNIGVGVRAVVKTLVGVTDFGVGRRYVALALHCPKGIQ